MSTSYFSSGPRFCSQAQSDSDNNNESPREDKHDNNGGTRLRTALRRLAAPPWLVVVATIHGFSGYRRRHTARVLFR